VIDDSDNLSRLTEVAHEFSADEVPQICTRKPRLRPSEFFSLRQNDFCNTIGIKADIAESDIPAVSAASLRAV
jgi:hypothetical protein